jgi:hypothetical protein
MPVLVLVLVLVHDWIRRSSSPTRLSALAHPVTGVRRTGIGVGLVGMGWVGVGWLVGLGLTV